ncbi:MAG: UbiD family decarboxylase [Rickettsiaceae bacterium]|nr:UbiD family decarboxylase [Rickettsiaceae bacterium]MDP4832774.1 UbiD family decarboxylase [Rickettsiaceae bacterium]MDP5020698.1 UbiD family decarboxylase [Rickettsiaceae bacterium]MDP5083271.1 UbiD family decarboxylase [Rickettsiaceae bacterium]
MSFKDLPEFLKFLEKNNQLKRITLEVATRLEITEISRRFLEQNGPALLFENVRKDDGSLSEFPVLTNLFANKERIAMGLGIKDSSELRELGKLLAFMKNPEPPSSLKETFSMLPLAKRILSMPPKTVSKAPSQETVIENPDINLLPIQTCWPGDVSPLITWPLIVTKGAGKDKTDNYNLGIYRLQPVAKNKLIMRWLKMRGGAAHHAKWKELKKEPMPAAAVIGANPAIILAAVMPIPNTISEYNFAGLLQNKSVELVQCKTIDLKVPAHAEIVIEGEVSMTEYLPEGPFGDHTGYYNDIEEFPVFNIKAITMKNKPIYLSTYTGKPPDEPSILGEALNEIFVPLIQQQFPEITDFYLPPEGCSYRIAVVSIKKTYPGQAKRIMMGVWSFLQQFMYTKFVIIVDEDIDVRDWKEVIWAISTRTDPKRDTSFIEHSPIDYLDFASPESGLGSKMGLDATNKLPPETKRNWGEKIQMDDTTITSIDTLWNKLQHN